MLLVFPESAIAATTYVTIGTGGVTGVYHPIGVIIARVVNKKRSEYGIRVVVQSTQGSVVNVDAVVSGDVEFGIVHSDHQYQAIHGEADWEEKGEQEILRAGCSLYSESVTLVVAAESGITTIADLKGRIVNIGEFGSEQRQNAIDVLEAVGLDYQKDLIPEHQDTVLAPKLLQDGNIDAFFYTVSHPNTAIKEATFIKEATLGSRKVRFIAVEGRGINRLLKERPYYARAIVPIELYSQVDNTKDIPTIGMKATFVTSADVPDDVIYAVTKEIFENLEEIITRHPALAGLTRENMLEGLTAPIHPGALSYYQEAGLYRLIPNTLR